MPRGTSKHSRRGTTAVEFAVACPITFFLLFAIMIGGAGVSRYQQVAALAREAARWASVHGTQFEEETGQPAATAQDIFETVIKPGAVAMDSRYLSCNVTWNRSNSPLMVITDVQKPVGNTVTVTVAYQWFPEMYVVGPIHLTSTSTAQMLY